MNRLARPLSFFLFHHSMRLKWQLFFHPDIVILIIHFILMYDAVRCTLHMSKFVSISNGQIFAATPVLSTKYVSIIILKHANANDVIEGLIFSSYFPLQQILLRSQHYFVLRFDFSMATFNFNFSYKTMMGNNGTYTLELALLH